jgi:hypothetical protein
VALDRNMRSWSSPAVWMGLAFGAALILTTGVRGRGARYAAWPADNGPLLVPVVWPAYAGSDSRLHQVRDRIYRQSGHWQGAFSGLKVNWRLAGQCVGRALLDQLANNGPQGKMEDPLGPTMRLQLG